ncbi:MAG: hypothetical protein ACKVU4_04055 [Phycisphaerales bacterium]
MNDTPAYRPPPPLVQHELTGCSCGADATIIVGGVVSLGAVLLVALCPFHSPIDPADVHDVRERAVVEVARHLWREGNER